MRKGTLLIPSGTDADPNRRHLFVALTDAQGPDDEVLLASFSTVTDQYFCEETCVLEPDRVQHPFIRHTSFIRYQRLKIVSLAALQEGIAQGTIVQMQDLSEEVTEEICAGLESSPFAAPKFKRFLARSRS